MKKYYYLFFAVVLTFVLFSACAKNKNISGLKEFKNADYGKYPAYYEKIINEYLEGTSFGQNVLNDLSISTPEKTYLSNYKSKFGSNPNNFCYRCRISYNIKNKHDGHLEIKRYYIYIKNNEIIYTSD